MNSKDIEGTPELLDANTSIDFRDTEDIHNIRDQEYKENLGREMSYEYLGLKDTRDIEIFQGMSR